MKRIIAFQGIPCAVYTTEKTVVAPGGPDLDLREAQIGIRDGKVEVQARERTISHRMIEAFMICANEAVAAFLRERCGLCLYRVHDKPSEERADAFRAYVRGMGLRGDFEPSDVRPRDYAAILREVEGDGKKGPVVREKERVIDLCKIPPTKN